MKGKRFLTKLAGSLIAGVLILSSNATYAISSLLSSNTTSSELYVALKNTFEDGWGYSIAGQPLNDNTGIVWNLISYPTSNSDAKEYNDDSSLYCVKAGVGFNDINDRRTYNAPYDLVDDKEDIKKLSTANYNSIANSEYYEELLWVFDNMYLPGISNTSDKVALMNAAFEHDDLLAGESYEDWDFKITDSDIQAVQQAVVWYFTNNDQSTYNQLENTNWLFYTKDGTSYSSLANYSYGTKEGELRNAQAEALYSYLITTAKANANKARTGDPITINTTTLGITTENGKNIVGPINITKNYDLTYSLKLSVKDQSDADITSNSEVEVLRANASGEKEVIGKASNFKDNATALVGSDFYISVPENLATTIKVDLSGSYSTTIKTYWVASNSNVEQPIVQVKKGDKGINKVLTATPIPDEPEKEFDLALKKYIAAVSKDQTFEESEYLKEADGTYTRAPVVNSITNGVVTYKEHDKTPVMVQNGDYVLYTFRIYNEGDVDGYASKIRDSIPEGLEYVVAHEINADYLWDIDEKSGIKSITTEYLAKGNGPELDKESSKANLLKALQKDSNISTTNPDYREIQAVFKVIENNGSDRILTNQAQIADDTDADGKEVNDKDSTTDEWIDGEDDQDIEKVKLQCFDLALRKFITDVDGQAPQISREPVVKYENGKITYEHTKNPLTVQIGDVVTYTIRVYNEGNIAGFAQKVADDIPEYLEYLPENETNKTYRWQVSEDGKSIATDYLSKEQGQTRGEVTLLNAFNSTQGITSTNPNYKDLKVAFKVKNPGSSQYIITNQAQIAEDADENGDAIDDIDSKPAQWNEGEDDQDEEHVKVQCFDLALRKFITDVQGKAPEVSREPVVKYENGKITYEHTKDPLTVGVENVVTYTIRVYNEGDIAGFAQKVSDDIPEYLEYLPENEINKTYRWQVSEDGKSITTDYLSKEQGIERGEVTLLNAFNSTQGITDTNPNYKDLKVAFKVKDPGSTEYIITNQAQIAEDADENGDAVDDIDSKPAEWNEGEDDQDVEHVKVEYFDLALKKFISKVVTIEDGKETIKQTGHTGEENPEPVVKVELHRKKLDQVVVKFGYTIKITNEGNIEGYAKEITDYVPEGLKFVSEDNKGWTDEGNNVISTKLLENTLLKPGESATVEVVLTWINGKDNIGLKTNTAEISEDYNTKDVPDRDSTPDNKVPGEDDIDDAQVLLAVSTGQSQVYYTLGSVVLLTIAGGIFLIKRYVI